MSTVKAANLQSTGSGAPTFQNSSGTEIGQLARAWINFNGESTVAIRDSFNVSSLTDSAEGRYVVNFATALPNANYILAGYVNDATSRCGIFGTDEAQPDFQTGSAKIYTSYISGTNGACAYMDAEFVHCVFFGA